MQVFRIKTTVSNEDTLTIKKHPFQPGDKVEVVVRGHEREREPRERYPLRGKPIHYIDPFGSVAEDEWNILQ